MPIEGYSAPPKGNRKGSPSSSWNQMDAFTSTSDVFEIVKVVTHREESWPPLGRHF